MPSKRTKKRSSRKSKEQFKQIRDLLIAGDLEQLIEKYRERPLEFLRRFGRAFPPKLERVLLDIYFGRVTRALLVACRGGGKSQLLSCIASVLYLFKKFDVLMLGGSAAQSKNDYNYTSEILTDNPTIESFSEDVLARVAESKFGNWIVCVAASTRAVRGPHAGDPHKAMGYARHGGCLMIDEECEAEEDVVNSSFFTVNTADPALTIRASTFHKAVGTFADAMDHARESGYTVYHWDCFDVARPCSDKCAECYVEFAGERHPAWKKFKAENPGFEPYCSGKAKTASRGVGWIKIADIKHYFKPPRSREEFEVEMLGRRPGSSGLVLNPNDVERCKVASTSYIPGMPGCITIDWGMKGTCALTVLQEQENHRIAVLLAKDFHMAPDSVIYDECRRIRGEWGFCEIYADASHPYQNFNLRANDGFRVNEVAFAQSKDLGVGVIKSWTENRLLGIPEEFALLIKQLKGWRKKDGRIVKKDDHFPDSLLCGALKWADTTNYVIEGQGTGIRREAAKIVNW